MFEISTGKNLAIRETQIPSLKVIDLPIHGDSRGWLKENWQREKMISLGLPDFRPVQNNISFNASPGVTRGIHAEPWDKYISVTTGRVFGAWVDLREGPSFGATYWCEIDPSIAVFVPRGVGNAFQALEENTTYTYLVNAHWSATAQSQYTYLNLADETANIPWPIPLKTGHLSGQDTAHPQLSNLTPIKSRKTLVIGSTGQLGKALKKLWHRREDVVVLSRDVIDLTHPKTLRNINWSEYSTVINAAAYTHVDAAESVESRAQVWATNAEGPATLAKIAAEHQLILVHISTDYVFDGTEQIHTEDEPFTPLGVYGQAKAAGDYAVSTTPHHYILRTSWAIGEGKNFVQTMASLAERGTDPSVVSDQIGRLSFTETIARAIDHLLTVEAEFGAYNVSNAGHPTSWADIAKRVYKLTGHNPERVTPVTTQEYFAGKEKVAPRPAFSTLNITKLEETGFYPPDQFKALAHYLEQ